MTHYLYNHFHIFISLYENTNYQDIIDTFNKQYYSNYSIYFICSKNITFNHPYLRVITIDQNINYTILQQCKNIPVNDLVIVMENMEENLNELWLDKMNQYFLHNKPSLMRSFNETYWISKAGIFIHILNHTDKNVDLKQLCFDLSYKNIHIYDMNNDIFEKVESKSSVKLDIPVLNTDVHLLLATYMRNKNIPIVLNMLKTQTVKNIHLHLLDNNEDTNIQTELDSLLEPFYTQLPITLHRYNKNLHCFGRISIVKEIIQYHMMDYIIIFDDDQIYHETWLENMIIKAQPLSTLSWYGKIFKVCDYWKSLLWYTEIEKMVRPEVKEWSYFGPGGSMIDIQLFSFEELYQYKKYSQDIRAIDDIWMSFIFKKFLNITFHRNITHPKCCIDARKLHKMTWANIKDKKSVLFKLLSQKYEWDVTKTTHNYYNINSFFDKIYVFCNNFSNLEKFRKHHICFQWVQYDNYEEDVRNILERHVNKNICIFHEEFNFREFYFYDCQKMVEKLHHNNLYGSFNVSMELIETISYHPSFGIYRLKYTSEEKNKDNVYMKLNFTSNSISQNKQMTILSVCPVYNQYFSKIIQYMLQQKQNNWGLLLINNKSDRFYKNDFDAMKEKYKNDTRIRFINNNKYKTKGYCLNIGLDVFIQNKNFTHFHIMEDCNEYYHNFTKNVSQCFSTNKIEFVHTNFYERFPNKKWADAPGSYYKDGTDLLVNYKNNIACCTWSKNAMKQIGKFDNTIEGCEIFDYVYNTFTLLNNNQIKFDESVNLTSRTKTHSKFPKEIDHINEYKINNHVIMCSHSNLAHTAGDTIMWSNWANYFMKNGKHVILISKYPIPQQFLNNLQSKNYDIIVKTNDSEIVAEMDKLESKQGSIFIRNHEILDMLKNKPYLPKITFYGLDVHINGLSKMDNKFQKIITQSEQLKDKFIDAGIIESKIEIKEPLVFKYNFKLPKRNDNEIRLIYCGTLRDEENILEIIEEFQKIHKERPEVVLKIVYGKINGNAEFTQKVNHYIKKGVKGITFKHNLSHKDSCYEIATSDIGICWRKNGWGDNGEVSTKVKEYELYGLAILNDMKVKVGIVTATNKLDKIYNIVKNFKQQLYFNKKLFLVVNDNKINVTLYNNILKNENFTYQIIVIDQKHNLGYCLNEAINQMKEQKYDVFTKFDDDDIYERKYLLEQVYYLNQMKQSIIGKYNIPIFIPEHNNFYTISNFSKQNQYAEFCRGSSITFYVNNITHVFDVKQRQGIDSIFLKEHKHKGGNIYVTSFNNYIWIRYLSSSKHTWKLNINDLKLVKLNNYDYNLNRIGVFSNSNFRDEGVMYIKGLLKPKINKQLQSKTSYDYSTIINTITTINNSKFKLNNIVKTNVKVSIIMTVFNEEETLEYAIKSILNQTYKNIEFIIIDDKSTDNTCNILKKYCNINNVRIILNKQNLGCYNCKNIALKHVTGDFVFFQDADDLSNEKRIEKMVNYMILHNLVVCKCYFTKFDDSNKMLNDGWPAIWNNKDIRMKNPEMAAITIGFRSEIFKLVGNFDRTIFNSHNNYGCDSFLEYKILYYLFNIDTQILVNLSLNNILVVLSILNPLYNTSFITNKIGLYTDILYKGFIKKTGLTKSINLMQRNIERINYINKFNEITKEFLTKTK